MIDNLSEHVTTFHGVPAVSRSVRGPIAARVGIVGAPFDSGGTAGSGAASAPGAIRTAGHLAGLLSHVVLEQLFMESGSVIDFGDIALTGTDPFEDLTTIEAEVTKVAALAPLIITLGGNHTITTPLVKALATRQGTLRLVVFDAHLDTWEEDEGIEPGHGSTLLRCLQTGVVSGGAVIGWRGYGPNVTHREWTESRNIKVWTMEDVDKHGLAALVQRECERPDVSTYLSIDIDAVDPACAPGTGTPEPGGLASREILPAVRTLAANCNLVGVDITEVHPHRDIGNLTVTLANRLVLEVIAGTAYKDQAAAS